MNTYVKGRARFTVITEGCIRIEYAENGDFLDEPTLFAIRENTAEADFFDSENSLTVKTEKLTLTYEGTDEFAPDNLYCNIHTAGISAVWHYYDE